MAEENKPQVEIQEFEPTVVEANGFGLYQFRPPAPGTATLRPYGLCSGQFTVPDDFDEPLPEDIMNLYEGQ